MQDTPDHICICKHHIEEHDVVDDIPICYKCNCTFWHSLDFDPVSDF
jgi:hypothetical protein